MATDRSTTEFDFAATQVATLESNRREIQRRRRQTRLTALLAGAALLGLTVIGRGRRLAERHRFWCEGVVLLGPLFVAAGGFMVADYITGFRLASVLFGLVMGALSVGGFYALFFQPPMETVVALWHAQTARRTKALEELKHLQEHAAANAADLKAWRSRLADLKTASDRDDQQRNQEVLLQQLLRRDWKSLRSIELEKFLEDVLVIHGYRIETTKITGEQGVDLVVAKDEVRIAIWVKGHTYAVGEVAVQQAMEGAARYRCPACAVITNNVFTLRAIELANSSRCLLIGEKEFEAFVLGKLDLVRATVGRRDA